MKHFFRISLVIVLFISVSAAGYRPGEVRLPEFTNLKVLPLDISKHELDSVMRVFSVSLGVKCNFCHALAPDTVPRKHLDFASDEKQEKATAREMMKMTAHINTSFFNWDNSTRPDTLRTVMCYTCHRGAHEPGPEALMPQLDSIMRSMMRH
jgi:hypothetical protein